MITSGITSVTVSVVVPTYRRPDLLERCLKALLAQTFAPDAYEIIIVDDGPETPETRMLVEAWQQRLRDRYAVLMTTRVQRRISVPVTGSAEELFGKTVYEVSTAPANFPMLRYLPAWNTRGPAAARNLGWRSARGQIIAFTDDDTIPDANWLASGVDAFVDGVAGVSGRVIVPLPEHPTDNERNTTHLERSHFVTANCFYRRTALEEAGGFDECFGMAWREDSDLFFTMQQRGWPLAWSKSAVVVHPVRPEKWGSSIRAQKKSYYNALLYKKHPALYRKFIQARPPWHYYGMVLSLSAGLVALLNGRQRAAKAGFAGWLAFMARFITNRLNGTSHAPAHVAEMTLTSLVIPFLSIYWRLRGAIKWRVWFL